MGREGGSGGRGDKPIPSAVIEGSSGYVDEHIVLKVVNMRNDSSAGPGSGPRVLPVECQAKCQICKLYMSIPRKKNAFFMLM